MFQQPNDIPNEVPEVEMFEVELQKDSQGLGITIAGYVGTDKSPGLSSIRKQKTNFIIQCLEILAYVTL